MFKESSGTKTCKHTHRNTNTNTHKDTNTHKYKQSLGQSQLSTHVPGIKDGEDVVDVSHADPYTCLGTACTNEWLSVVPHASGTCSNMVAKTDARKFYQHDRTQLRKEK